MTLFMPSATRSVPLASPEKMAKKKCHLGYEHFAAERRACCSFYWRLLLRWGINMAASCCFMHSCAAWGLSDS